MAAGRRERLILHDTSAASGLLRRSGCGLPLRPHHYDLIVAQRTDLPLLIIGAGPFGLAAAAYAACHDIPYQVVGEPMAFWKASMPDGMLLRSTCNWHLDPIEAHTIDAYLASQAQSCRAVEPLSLDFYLGYASWFMRQHGIRPQPRYVRCLDWSRGGFIATFESGPPVRARNVLVAVGLRHFAHSPDEITSLLPPDSHAHTCNWIDMHRLRGRRCLIVGGRQSAFEWAALLREAGVARVHLSYRHDTPAFEASDWSWVEPLVERTVIDGEWFRRLPGFDRDAITERMWREGRAKLEPWLKPRIEHDAVQLWPNTRIRQCVRSETGVSRVLLDNGQLIEVDQILLATGYEVDLSRIPFLRYGNVWNGLALSNGYPHLDDSLQTSCRGLFITGQPAVQDFGPFFGFTVAVRASAARVGQALLRQRLP